MENRNLRLHREELRSIGRHMCATGLVLLGNPGSGLGLPWGLQYPTGGNELFSAGELVLVVGATGVTGLALAPHPASASG